MHYVLDANVIVGGAFGASVHLRTLLSASRDIGYTVYVPRIVLEEVFAKYSRALASKVEEANKVLAALSRLLDRDYKHLADGLDVGGETKGFQERLLGQLVEARSVILEYPDTPHADLVKRATLRKRPFDNKGHGYRDALIWQTVIELATQVEGTVILVSQDNHFADGQGNLHSDLIEDLIGLGLPQDKVTLAPQLATLFDEHVRTKLRTISWDCPLRILAQQGMNLEEFIGLRIQEAYFGQEWNPSKLGLPYEYESPMLDEIEEVSNLVVVDSRELSPNQILVKIGAETFGDFGVFVYKPDWYISDDPRLNLDDFDWSDHYVRAKIAVPLRCELDLVVDVSHKGQYKIKNVSVKLCS